MHVVCSYMVCACVVVCNWFACVHVWLYVSGLLVCMHVCVFAYMYARARAAYACMCGCMCVHVWCVREGVILLRKVIIVAISVFAASDSFFQVYSSSVVVTGEFLRLVTL